MGIIMENNTIVAIATALSNSGIGIIRMSGENSICIADQIFRNGKLERKLMTYKSHTIHYGHIMNEDEILDEVMITVLKAPATYTKEDTIEINCHGGVVVMNKILQLLLTKGARLAEPGEFTKRAFLNGRIDLAKAEAVMDIIHSKNELSLQASLKQLKGNVSNLIKTLRESVLFEIAFIESALDDPEHISLDGYSDRLLKNITFMKQKITRMIEKADYGKIMKEGIHTVIVGKPNAGKSSFLNALLGEERAIVTDIAGTTRDVLEESVKIGSIHLNLIDTAGIRDTVDVVEKIGVEKARKYAKDADLIIYIVDSSVLLDENDRTIINMIENKNVIVLLNKADLINVVSEEDIKKELDTIYLKNLEIIKTSTKEIMGFETFTETIETMFLSGIIEQEDEILITTMRHKDALIEANESLLQVLKSIEHEMPEDFLSIDLMNAYRCLGKIIGEEVEDDLVTEIFSKFCMGK
jgi:tRNA modification GTPase